MRLWLGGIRQAAKVFGYERLYISHTWSDKPLSIRGKSLGVSGVDPEMDIFSPYDSWLHFRWLLTEVGFEICISICNAKHFTKDLHELSKFVLIMLRSSHTTHEKLYPAEPIPP